MVVSCLEFICNGKEYIFPSTSTRLQARIPADSYAFTVSTLAMNTSMSYSSTGKIWSLEIDSMGGYHFAWLYGWYSDRMLDFGPIYLFRPRSNSITSYRRHGRVISDGTYLYYTEMFVSLSNNLTNSITVGVFKKTLNATSWTACTNSDISLYVARSTEISV